VPKRMRGPDGEGVVGVDHESHLSRWAGRMMTCNVTSSMFISLCHSEFDIFTCTPILGFQSMIMQVHDYGGPSADTVDTDMKTTGRHSIWWPEIAMSQGPSIHRAGEFLFDEIGLRGCIVAEDVRRKEGGGAG
jgi:hypothetical protein